MNALHFPAEALDDLLLYTGKKGYTVVEIAIDIIQYVCMCKHMLCNQWQAQDLISDVRLMLL